MTIHSLHHVAIVTPDLERAVNFYTQTLGMKLIARVGETIAFIDIGGTRLELLAKDVAEAQSEPTQGLVHLAWQVSDIQGAYEALAAKGVQFHVTPRPALDGQIWVAFFKDPDGNILELFYTSKPELAAPVA